MLKWFKNKFRQPWREMSMGEIIDKVSILNIKIVKRAYSTESQLEDLQQQARSIMIGIKEEMKGLDHAQFDYVIKKLGELHQNNLEGWDAEDAVMKATTPEATAKAAKLSRDLNLNRARLKRELDLVFDEKYLEIKNYSKNKHLE